MPSLVFLALAAALLPWTVGGSSVACGLLLLSCAPHIKGLHGWKRHPLFNATLFLWLAQGLGYFLSEDRELGWKYATTIWPIFFIFIAQAVTRRQGKVLLLGIIFLTSAAFAAFYSTGLSLGWWADGVKSWRASGTLIPFMFSSLMLIALFSILDLGVRSFQRHWLLLFALPLFFFALIGEGSRLIIPGFIGALFFFLLFLPAKGKRKSAFLILVGFTLPIAAFGPESALGQRIEHALTGSDFAPRASLGQRASMWKAAEILFLESPILGCGIGDFKLDSHRLYESHEWFEGRALPGQHHNHAHSLYFQRLCTQGLLGMGAFAWWMFTLFCILWKGIPFTGVWGRSGVLGFVILLSMGVGDIMFKSHYLLGPCLLAGIALGLEQRLGKQKDTADGAGERSIEQGH